MRLRNKKRKRKTEGRPEPETSSNLVINHWERLSDGDVVSILSFLPQKDLLNVSLISKKFRDVSRDSSLWTKLNLNFNDVKKRASSCSKLIDRCRKLTSLEITNKSLNLRSLNYTSVVIKAKKSSKSLKVDGSIRRLSDAAFKKFGQMKEHKSSKLTLATNSHNPSHEVQLLSNLDQPKEPCVCVRWRFGDSRAMGTAAVFLNKALYRFKKLRKVDLEMTDSTTLDGFASNNPDPGAPPSLMERSGGKGLGLGKWSTRMATLHQLMIENLEIKIQ